MRDGRTVFYTTQYIFLKFPNREMRNEWLEALQTLKEVTPVFVAAAPAFEEHVEYPLCLI